MAGDQQYAPVNPCWRRTIRSRVTTCTYGGVIVSRGRLVISFKARLLCLLPFLHQVYCYLCLAVPVVHKLVQYAPPLTALVRRVTRLSSCRPAPSNLEDYHASLGFCLLTSSSWGL